MIATPVSAAVNDFTISQYDIDFNLSRDDTNHSVLTTRETIFATFPSSNQNHGIERYIPKKYDGHSTQLDIQSVTRQDGTKWNYTTYDSGGYTVVRIGDADKYLHGSQAFVLAYTQRDVTRYFADTGADEFYWDANGTEWQVPIESLTVKLTIDKTLTSSLNGNTACYQGAFSERGSCQLMGEDDEAVYATNARNLGKGENVTIALGFKPGTFTAYKKPVWEQILIGWFVVQGIALIASVGLLIFLGIRFSKWSDRKSDVATIVPEYLPPKGTSVQTAAVVVNSPYSFSAQLIDLAVRHYIKIYETKPKSFWSAAQYDLEIVKPIDTLTTEEKEFVSDIFDDQTAPGSKINTKMFKGSRALYAKLRDNPKKLQDLVRGTYGIREKDAVKSAWFRRAGFVCLGAAVVLLSPVLLIVAIIIFVMSYSLWPLTDKGVELSRYLQGLKMYISVAEEERLRLMQSPEGAQKASVDAGDTKQLVKLYERVLPYAVLFGQEKQWNKQLGTYYQESGTQPDWFGSSHMATFNAAAFAGAMSGFTSSINASGASSSSTGGSSGGGSSGGGGGGGGGGGW